MTEPITFSSDPTFAEFRVSACALQQRHRWLIVLYVALGLSIGFSFALGTSLAARVAAGATLVLFYTIYMAAAAIQSSRLREAWKSWNAGNRSFTFSDAGVTLTSTTSVANFSWPAFDRIVTGKGVLTCVLGHGSFMCIPRRNIPADRAEELLALLDLKIAPRDPAR